MHGLWLVHLPLKFFKFYYLGFNLQSFSPAPPPSSFPASLPPSQFLLLKKQVVQPVQFLIVCILLIVFLWCNVICSTDSYSSCKFLIRGSILTTFKLQLGGGRTELHQVVCTSIILVYIPVCLTISANGQYCLDSCVIDLYFWAMDERQSQKLHSEPSSKSLWIKPGT